MDDLEKLKAENEKLKATLHAVRMSFIRAGWDQVGDLPAVAENIMRRYLEMGKLIEDMKKWVSPNR